MAPPWWASPRALLLRSTTRRIDLSCVRRFKVSAFQQQIDQQLRWAAGMDGAQEVDVLGCTDEQRCSLPQRDRQRADPCAVMYQVPAVFAAHDGSGRVPGSVGVASPTAHLPRLQCEGPNGELL